MQRLLTAGLAVAALASATVAYAAPVAADLKDAAGATVGVVTLTEAPKGVLMRIEARGLTPGWHGAHFHEKGDCSKSDFTSAGAHVHPTTPAAHGLLNPAANDQGDLPNVHADANGVVAAEVFSALVTLPALRDADGSAVVIHANADDHTTQPIGGAGPRVACAVVK